MTEKAQQQEQIEPKARGRKRVGIIPDVQAVLIILATPAVTVAFLQI